MPVIASRHSSPKPPSTSSEPLSKSSKPPVKPKPKDAHPKRFRWLKWLFWGGVIVGLYFGYQWLLVQAETWLQAIPAMWAVYQAIKQEIATKSLLGLFYVSFFGALFFLPMPVEAVFIYYLQSTGYYYVQIITITLLGNLLGITFDYFVGWFIGPKILKWVMRKKFDTFREKLSRAGAFLIVIGNIIPFPIEPLTVVLGGVKYGYVRLMIFTIIGKLTKFVMLYLAFTYFTDYLAPYVLSLDLGFLELVKSPFQ